MVAYSLKLVLGAVDYKLATRQFLSAVPRYTFRCRVVSFLEISSVNVCAVLTTDWHRRSVSRGVRFATYRSAAESL